MKDLDVIQTLYRETYQETGQVKSKITNWNIALKIKLHGAS